MTQKDSALSWEARHPETPAQFKGLHKFLMAVATFFFVWLVVEGFFLIPWLLIRYGGQ